MGSLTLGLDVKDVSVATSQLNPYGSLEASPPSYLLLQAPLKLIPDLQAPTRDEQMPGQKAFRKGVGKNWWITFDILDVTESSRPYLNASLRASGTTASLCL
jgi:hypothetical protein